MASCFMLALQGCKSPLEAHERGTPSCSYQPFSYGNKDPKIDNHHALGQTLCTCTCKYRFTLTELVVRMEKSVSISLEMLWALLDLTGLLTASGAHASLSPSWMKYLSARLIGQLSPPSHFAPHPLPLPHSPNVPVPSFFPPGFRDHLSSYRNEWWWEAGLPFFIAKRFENKKIKDPCDLG